jgi:hypothetical protein
MEGILQKLTPHEILTNAYNWWLKEYYGESIKESYERYKEYTIENDQDDLLTLTELEYHINRFKK